MAPVSKKWRCGRDVQHVEGIFRLLGQVHQLLLQPLYLLHIIIRFWLYPFHDASVPLPRRIFSRILDSEIPI